MDPVSHVVLGRVLVRAGSRASWTRELGWAAGIGALSPDIDAVLMPFGFDLYLALHERVTHSVSGALVCAAVVAFGVSAWRRSLPGSAVVAAAAVGALSHLAADLIAGGTIRPLWPASDAVVANLGLIAMGDPWVMAIFATSLVAALLPSQVARYRLHLAVLIVFLALLGVKAIFRFHAESVFPVGTTSAALTVSQTEAEWGSVTGWRIYRAYGDELRSWDVDAWTGQVRVEILAYRRLQTSDWVNAFIDASPDWMPVRNFLRAHHPMAFVRSSLEDGVTRVEWSDLRYCSRDPLDGPAQPPFLREPVCSLWFGGRVDSSGILYREFVRIGSYEQRR